MKVTFLFGIGSFSGMIMHAIFWPTLHRNASYMRRYKYPSLTENNLFFGLIVKNIGTIFLDLTPESVTDLSKYSELWEANSDPNDPFAGHQNSMSMFTLIFWASYNSDRSLIDPTTVDLQGLQTAYPDFQSVAKLASSNIIPNFNGAEYLDYKFI